MAKVHPHLLSSSSSSYSRFEERSTGYYTVWMKSLVFNGNGCTIFDANGNVVYRVDNYDSKSCSQVFLMDLKGRVLSTLLKKKLRVNEHWNGYKNDRVNKEKAWFQVKKKSKLFSKGDGFSCQVKIRGDDFEALSCFKIQGSYKKSEFKIVRGDGLMVAQVKRKQSKQGVLLGDDVLSLEIEPNLDHSFIISLVIIHGLMSHKM
ncbi:protein LURP-one-related 11-like [Amaranthus tricolor]|uniref:protein LURP-one-related 11-like n=1 Tax=Amaranthus tricolor TaxID=29722 RepID=UPI00258343B3|nr:protein LURP-one-related 11-like [Amaranthus tricolor]